MSEVLQVEEVSLVIPFPKSVRTATLTVSCGSCLYDEATKVAKWTIGKLNSSSSGGANAATAQLTGTMVLHGHKPEDCPPIQVPVVVSVVTVAVEMFCALCV